MVSMVTNGEGGTVEKTLVEKSTGEGMCQH